MTDRQSQGQTEQKLYTFEDAARVLGNVSAWTLRRHVGQGTLKATRIGRRVFLHADTVRRIAAEGLPSL